MVAYAKYFWSRWVTKNIHELMCQHNDLVEGFIHTLFIYNYCIALQVLFIAKYVTYHTIRQYAVVSSIRKLKYCSVNTSTQKRIQPTKIFLFLSSMLKWLVSNALLCPLTFSFIPSDLLMTSCMHKLEQCWPFCTPKKNLGCTYS